MNPILSKSAVPSFGTTVILIPAYKPEPILPRIVQRLREAGFALLVVDDGSGKEYREIFRETEAYATVLSYPQNKGKGGALKTGLSYIWEQLPEAAFVVTADADGQHAFGDICAVAELLQSKGGIVIGSRDFKGDIPFRSAVGNNLSRFVYAIAAGRFIHDNQSGLRGFPRKEIPWMLKVNGTKYDYEMNVLMYAAKKRLSIREHTIRTIYENNNACSHFNPLKDTCRIYKRLFAAAGISIVSLLCNLLLAVLLAPFLKETGLPQELAIPASTVASLALAGLLSLVPGILPIPFVSLAFGHLVAVSLLRALGRCGLTTLFLRLFHWDFFPAYTVAILLLVPLEYLVRKLLFRLSPTGRAVAKSGT